MMIDLLKYDIQSTRIIGQILYFFSFNIDYFIIDIFLSYF